MLHVKLCELQMRTLHVNGQQRTAQSPVSYQSQMHEPMIIFKETC
jgi:hypothetical protein